MAETLSPTYKLFKGLSVNAGDLYRESTQFLQQKFKNKGEKKFPHHPTIFLLSLPSKTTQSQTRGVKSRTILTTGKFWLSARNKK